jgi:hypothetical protein
MKSDRVVVGPEGDGEAIDFEDSRFDPRVERGNGGRNRGEPLSDLDLESGDHLPSLPYSSQDVTGGEAQSELVGVVNHDGVVDLQAEPSGKRCHRGHCTRYAPSLHEEHPDTARSSTSPAPSRQPPKGRSNITLAWAA